MLLMIYILVTVFGGKSENQDSRQIAAKSDLFSMFEEVLRNGMNTLVNEARAY